VGFDKGKKGRNTGRSSGALKASGAFKASKEETEE
jgi:hypothetical protein